MIKKIISLFLVLFSLWGVGFLWFVTIIPTSLDKKNEKADAIVVLTGGALRLEHGFELLANKRAAKLFISGVEDSVKLNELLYAKEYRQFTDKISAKDVILGYKARSTRGNAEEIYEWVRKENIHKILLVTGNYHIPRSVKEIKNTSTELEIISEPVFPTPFENNNWFISQDGIRLMLSEYNKYLLVSLRLLFLP